MYYGTFFENFNILNNIVTNLYNLQFCKWLKHRYNLYFLGLRKRSGVGEFSLPPLGRGCLKGRRGCFSYLPWGRMPERQERVFLILIIPSLSTSLTSVLTCSHETCLRALLRKGTPHSAHRPFSQGEIEPDSKLFSRACRENGDFPQTLFVTIS